MGKLWYGGMVYTMTKENETVEAIFTENGTILDIGKLDELKNKYSEQIDEEITFKGTLLPGFIDSHLHIIGHGEKLLRLDLSEVFSRKEVIQKVKKAANNIKDHQWLIGEGFNENNWDNPVLIHRHELDEISGGKPVVLTRVCRHALVANTRAIELAGLNEQTEDVPGGVIERNHEGELTGVFHDQAQELIKNYMPTPDLSFLKKAVETSVKDLLSQGIVSGHSEDLSYYGSFEQTYDAFKQIIPGRQKFRAHLLVHHLVVDDLHSAGHDPGKQDDWLEFGAMKLFVDGALGGRTALLSEPYEDDPTTNGVSIHTDEGLEALVKKARQYNMPIAAHAIGDQAAEDIVRLIEKYPPPKGMKDRIIHAQIMRPDLIKRIKELPLILDIQPLFVASDFPWVIDRVGEKRAKESYPWNTYLKEDILCGGGSDAPIEVVDPMVSIDAAVNRISSYDGQTHNESESLSVFDAIQLYTVNPAKIIGKEHIQGQIKPGYYADFVILNKNPFEINKNELKEIKVKQTIVNEEIVFEQK
ncbi:amidohydrolase [Filobacillus milosensis]|uniref:Amidohydrolase n=1 Tax=Filobacillus milosensis TaxID=94137 RepID=A0A4Y8IV52_9BACI|nr:amidohydrolase [Filobacillus milosensis]TFB25049.1 amidohydrolase [Filobacillus milosensis]